MKQFIRIIAYSFALLTLSGQLYAMTEKENICKGIHVYSRTITPSLDNQILQSTGEKLILGNSTNSQSFEDFYEKKMQQPEMRMMYLRSGMDCIDSLVNRSKRVKKTFIISETPKDRLNYE